MLVAAIEAAAFITAIFWLLSRGSIAISASGGWRSAQFAIVDAAACLMFGGFLVLFESRQMAAFAANSVIKWALVLAPAATYFYFACFFSVWRWQRRAGRGQAIQVQWRPRTPAAWAIYLWFAAWIFWEIIHGFAPWMLPSWLN